MKKLIPIIIVLMFIKSPAYCTFSKVGTAAAQFLKIGVGARAMGMGETFVAIANDATTHYWNPAGLASLRTMSLAVSHSIWFADIYHEYVGFSVPFGYSNVIGISAIALNTNEQEVTTVHQPDGAGIYYDVSDIAVGLSFARALTDRFSTGVTVKYIQQNAYNETANSLAIDIGTYLRTGYHGLTIAMCMSNFGGKMQLQGRDLIALTDIDKTIAGNYNTDTRLKTDSWSLPLNFRVGVAMDFIGGADSFFPIHNNRLTVAIDGNHPNDNNERVNFGGEYAWQETIFARAGYSYKLNSNEDERRDAKKWSFGGGLKFDIGRQSMSMDFAMVDFGDLGKVSRFSVELKF